MPRKKAKARKAVKRRSPGKAKESAAASATTDQGSTAPQAVEKELPERYGLSPYQ
ncbi:MAG: hypothetical protein JRN06_12530 [Nitrososphaerota archaeon]|nr:hypothetical protein [Nitrososphaerota archaeon]